MIDDYESASKEVNVFIGKKLRMRRIMLGLSQAHLATAMGITFQQIQKYEKGSNGASAARLLQFSSILSVPVAYFFEDLLLGISDAGSSSPNAKAVSISGLSSEQARLLGAFNRIPSAELRLRVSRLVTELSMNSN